MNEWISVENKLPEFHEKVLFYCILDEFIKNIYMGYLTEDGWDIYLPYQSFKLTSDAPDIIKVTHWMELPEFPIEFLPAANNEAEVAGEKVLVKYTDAITNLANK